MESPEKPSNLRKQAVKGLAWSAIENWGRQGVSLIVFFVLARLLNPEIFGLVALASVFLGFVQIFLDQGFSQALIQRQELEAEHLDTAFWTTLTISVFLTVLSISCAGLAANFFDQPQLTPIIQYLSISFIFSGLSSVQSAILTRNLAFKTLAIRSLIAVVFGGMVGVGMAFLNFGVWSLVGQQISNSLLQVLVLWRVSDWRPGFKFSAIHAKELYAFGINVTAFSIINFFNRRSDDLLIGRYLGSVALGYYSVAYRILQVMTQVLISTIGKVAFPVFSRLQGEPERLIKAFYNVTEVGSTIAFPMFLSFTVLAPELVQILFGKQWTQSIPVMQVLALIGPVHIIAFYNSSVIMALGKPAWRLWIQIINTVVNVVSFILVVKWGILAVASAYVIRGYLLLPISLVAIHKLVKLNFIQYLRLYMVPLVASLGMIGSMIAIKYLLVTFIGIEMKLLTASLILVGTLSYIFIVFVISPKLFKKILGLTDFVNIKLKRKKKI
ncbi:MAG: lipopolysaccharide biosynthesis protein [Trichormus sp. ATA11-4-KO1]|jgi:PST family polysaccharide transporter|nr:lipopolysaccharide biosynthesis protein [Trichormus sp. ATA11-4-KO1]